MKTIKNATHPVAIAVAPLKLAAMKTAEKLTRKQVAQGWTMLSNASFDLDVVAPRPNSLKDSTPVYREKAARRQFFTSFTRSVKGYRMPGEPDIVAVDDSLVERLVRMAREDAEASFIGYVNKLVAKIGDGVKSATLARTAINDNLWYRSVLNVAMTNGTKEVWETKQIWNTSVLGKVFPQWPTRQTEGAKRERVVKARTVHFRDTTIFKHYSYGFACAGSAMGAQRLLQSATYTDDRSKVTCTRCQKWVAIVDARRAAEAAKQGA